MKPRSRRASALSVSCIGAFTTVLITGCTTDGVRVGDDIRLTEDRDSGEVCMSQSAIDDLSFGMETINVVKDHPVEIIDVHLVKPRGDIDLIDSYVIPEKYRGEYGAIDGWPGLGVSKEAHRAIKPIPGAVVPPKTKDSRPGLLVHLRAGPGSGFQGVTIDYRRVGTDDVRRTDRSYIRFTVRKDC